MGILLILEEKIEEIESREWKGRNLDFPRHEEVHDILLIRSMESDLHQIIREKGNLLDFQED